jgi:predicted DNA-binding transcriptional regulator AlpA
MSEGQPTKLRPLATVHLVQTPPAILRREGAAAFMGISVAVFERLVARGKLPKPRQISDGCSGWLYSELLAAAEALPVSQLAPGPGRQAAPGAQPGA